MAIKSDKKLKELKEIFDDKALFLKELAERYDLAEKKWEFYDKLAVGDYVTVDNLKPHLSWALGRITEKKVEGLFNCVTVKVDLRCKIKTSGSVYNSTKYFKFSKYWAMLGGSAHDKYVKDVFNKKSNAYLYDSGYYLTLVDPMMVVLYGES